MTFHANRRGFSRKDRKALARFHLQEAREGTYSLPIAIRAARFAGYSWRYIETLTGIPERQLREYAQ